MRASDESEAFQLINSLIEDEKAKRLLESQWEHAFYIRPFKLKGIGHNLRKSKNQLRKNGLWLLDESKLKGLSWEDVQPLYAMHTAYMDVVIPPFMDARSRCDRLSKADLHGAHLEIIKSRSGSLVGTSGVVVVEGENSFVICTKGNRIVKVIKRDSVFKMDYDGASYIIHGMNFRASPANRSKMKIKSKFSISLRDSNSRFKEDSLRS